MTVTDFTELVQYFADLDACKLPPVWYSPNQTREPDCSDRILLLIGVEPGENDKEPLIVLNNKRPDSGLTVNADSVTDVVIDADERVVQSWREQLNVGTSQLVDPDSLLKRIALVMEDVSPDSCLAFTAFIARMTAAGYPSAVWQQHIRQWELGDVHSTGPYERSWAALQTTLAHSYFSADLTAFLGSATRGEEIQQALHASLRLLAVVLAAQAAPNDIPAQLSCPELVRARAFQAFESQTYHQSLTSAITLELLLPLSTTGRRMLVSAYIAREQFPLGAIKALARTDPNTWDGQGYGLMAVYRPGERGTGNDIVVSADPARGLTLEALWRRLEALEDGAWKGSRPCDDPRPIESYRKHLQAGEPVPNQPWWDDHGRYTLVAGPKALEGCTHKTRTPRQKAEVRDSTIDATVTSLLPDLYARGASGTLLNWEEVINSLWCLYNPAKELKFRLQEDHSDDRCVALDEVRKASIVVAGNARYRLIQVHWPKHAAQASLLCPTVLRYFAACIAHEPEEPIGPTDLPKMEAFDVVRVNGGFVVVHSRGLFALDDWSPYSLSKEDVHEEFNRAVTSAKAIYEVRNQLRHIREREAAASASGTVKRAFSRPQSLTELSNIRIRLHEAQIALQAASENPELQALRDSIERRFSLSQRIQEISQNIADIRDAAMASSTAQTNRMIELLTLYGFPAVLFTGFFGYIFQNVDFLGAFDGIQLDGLVLYAIFVVLGVGVIRSRIRLWEKTGGLETSPKRTNTEAGADDIESDPGR